MSVLQPGDVGDRAERHQIQQVDQLWLLAAGEEAANPQLPQERDAQQESHSDRGQMAMSSAKLALVEAVRIDHREGHRKQRRALVVIDDDHVEARVLRLLKRLEGLRPAIDGHGEAGAALLQLDQGRARTGRNPPSAGRGCRPSGPRQAGEGGA